MLHDRPRKFRDGPLSVAAHFSLRDDGTVQRVEDFVAGWVHGIVATSHIDFLDDFVVQPHVVRRGENSLDVVFDAKPGSQRWKDWMVFLTRDIQSSIPGVALEHFYDLVTNQVHPDSVQRGSR